MRGSRSLQALERGPICGISPAAMMEAAFSEGVTWNKVEFTDTSLNCGLENTVAGRGLFLGYFSGTDQVTDQAAPESEEITKRARRRCECAVSAQISPQGTGIIYPCTK